MTAAVIIFGVWFTALGVLVAVFARLDGRHVAELRAERVGGDR